MAKTKTTKYRDLISKTDTEIQTEQLDLNVEQAQNTLEQGTLSVKSQMITAESEVKKAKTAVTTAERALEATKSSLPLNVQSILNARTNVKQAQLDATAKEEVYSELKDAYDFLTALKTELF